jgi:TonB family protein
MTPSHHEIAMRSRTQLRILVIAALLHGGLAACSASSSQAGHTPDLHEAADTLVNGERVYVESEVDERAVAIPGFGVPRYPSELKSAHIEGRVEYRFVVDTIGLVEMGTVRQISASHPGLATAVRAAMPMMRFAPALRGDRRVRMWVRQAFEFRIGE